MTESETNLVMEINKMRGQLFAHRKMIEEFTNANLDQFSNLHLLNEKVRELSVHVQSLSDQIIKKDEEIKLLKEQIEAKPINQGE